MGKYHETCETCEDETITHGWVPDKCPFCELAKMREQRDGAFSLIDYAGELLGIPKQEHKSAHGFKILQTIKDLTAARGGGKWTEAQRITLFMENLANLCEEYGVTIHTESMQGWSPTLADDAEYHAVLPTGATPEDIRKAVISPSECW
jgi:hypothetical protein